MRIATITLVWTIVLVAGFISMAKYEFTPGESGAPPELWPASASDVISLTADQPALVVFAHPKCPCTRATMSELERLMVVNQDRVQTHVVFIKPAGVPDGWTQTDLWNHAGRILNTTVFADQDGSLSEMFQAKTSGTAVLYDSNKRLVFRGGLTSSRGHEGDNTGISSIKAFLNGQRPNHPTTPVYGCALHGADSSSGAKQ